MNIAIFGYAGNPPHLGHREVIEWLAARFDKVLISLSVSHAFGKQMAPLSARSLMSTALVNSTTATNIELTNIEELLYTGGPVYSYDVLAALQKQYPTSELHLAIGPDNAAPETWGRFYRADDIVREFHRVVAPDMGNHKRSTQVRELLESGATYEQLIELVPRQVADLIVTMPELYGAVKVK
jgi:nicotinate-nucleotide adenylyltransferase